jgi:hypothetical protein
MEVTSEPREVTATAAIRVRSNCGSGSDLYYLYAGEGSSIRYDGCLHNEVPREGRAYLTTDRRRQPTRVTMAPGFRRVFF